MDPNQRKAGTWKKPSPKCSVPAVLVCSCNPKLFAQRALPCLLVILNSFVRETSPQRHVLNTAKLLVFVVTISHLAERHEPRAT